MVLDTGFGEWFWRMVLGNGLETGLEICLGTGFVDWFWRLVFELELVESSFDEVQMLGCKVQVRNKRIHTVPAVTGCVQFWTQAPCTHTAPICGGLRHVCDPSAGYVRITKTNALSRFLERFELSFSQFPIYNL